MKVETYIYADVIFFENLVMNYFILWSTARLARIKFSKLKLLLAAVFGAIYAIGSYLPAYGYLYTFLVKVMFSLLIVVVAYTPNKIKEFLRVTGIFYVVSFVFGGAAFGLYYFINGLKATSQGISYISNFPVKTLLVSIAIAYIAVRYCWGYVQNKIKRERIITQLDISFERKNLMVNALIDTGNSLSDPLTNTPVIIAEYSAVKELLPCEIQRIFEENIEDDLNTIAKIMSESEWITRFRLIPFRSLGRENGMLIGFKPDRIMIHDARRNFTSRNIVVGIYRKKLSNDDEYNALIHPDLLNAS